MKPQVYSVRRGFCQKLFSLKSWDSATAISSVNLYQCHQVGGGEYRSKVKLKYCVSSFYGSNFLALKAIYIHLKCTKILNNRTRRFLLGLDKQPLHTRAFFFQKQLKKLTKISCWRRSTGRSLPQLPVLEKGKKWIQQSLRAAECRHPDVHSKCLPGHLVFSEGSTWH